MEVKIEQTTLTLKKGDITKEEVDAIVNAANSRLIGGGGVDGAIRRAAGPQVEDECARIRAEKGGCPTGKAVYTSAGNLKAKYIIHTVGPFYNGGKNNEAELLASAFKESMKVADSLNCTSIAFPAISTGIYQYPIDQAAEVSLQALFDYIRQGTNVKNVNMVLFDENAFTIFVEALKKKI